MTAPACEVCGEALGSLSRPARRTVGLLVCWTCGAAHLVSDNGAVLVSPAPAGRDQ